MYRRVVTVALLGLAVLGIAALMLLWYNLQGGPLRLPEVFPTRPTDLSPSPFVVTFTPTPETPWTPAPTSAQSTPTATAVAIPGGWELFENRSFPLVLAYPPEWSGEGGGQSAARFAGEDGFFQLEYYRGPGVTLEQACEWQANHDLTLYGDTPELDAAEINGLPACLIRTSLSVASARGAAIIASPGQVENWDQRFLLLSADVLHFEQIAASAQAAGGLRIASDTPPPIQLTPAATPDGLLPSRERTWNGLQWTEFRVVEQDVDTPSHAEFWSRLPGAVEEEQSEAARQERARALEEANAALAPFGYRLEGEEAGEASPTLRLMQGDEAVLRQVVGFQPPAVNEAGDDFALVLDAVQGYFLLQAGGLQPWDTAVHEFTPPSYLGDRLLTVESLPGALQVLADGEQIFRYALGEHLVQSPVEGLWVEGESWLLLVNGMLVADGEIQNQTADYDEVFGWQRLNGKPFFFFVRQGRVGLHWDGEDLPDLYDEVIHDRCCEPAMFNVQGYPGLVRFFARAEGFWWLAVLAPAQPDGL